ncbi:hypothetical protein Tco_1040075 [Tanacetum coccineum]
MNTLLLTRPLERGRKTGKDTEQSKKAKSTGTSKGTTKSQPKSTGKSTQAEEIVFEAGDTQVPQDLREDMGNTDEPPVVKADPKDWFKKPKRPPSPDPEWNKGDRYSFDLSKPLPLVQSRNRQIIPVDYFFNNDLAYLQGESTGRTYTTSLTKTKATKYDLPGIKDMVPNLWSPIKVAYDKHALLGTSHWGPKRQRFYGYASKRVFKHDVYSTKRILAVRNVKVNVWYGYGHLEEIGQTLQPQRRGHCAPGRCITYIIQKRVEDLQLGVESYQKKLNISKTRTRKEDLSRRAPYTTLLDPQGVIYEDKLNIKRLMRSDELYKFSDGTW